MTPVVHDAPTGSPDTLPRRQRQRLCRRLAGGGEGGITAPIRAPAIWHYRQGRGRLASTTTLVSAANPTAHNRRRERHPPDIHLYLSLSFDDSATALAAQVATKKIPTKRTSAAWNPLNKFT